MSIDQLLTTLSHLWMFVSCSYQKYLYEIILVFISIAVHILDARQHILGRILIFPNLLLNVHVYSIKRLYGKVFYSVVSVLLNVYAYFQWKGAKTRPPVQVSRTTEKMLFCIMAVGLFGALGWSFLMSKCANIPLSTICLDAIYSSFGFVEKWLMSRKKLERWILAFFRYVTFSIACYNAGSVVLMLQHIVLAIIAIYGQVKWYRSYKKC
ncbi:nicotinamide mononucleotide transporter family protein [Cardinium endosymbiont of Tipula unca]|uniref:nicotinamide mononucleotide transporter family protein n=1 Tax=Cardinium endosymbiont of Tipula unca TaxID=3066216 RepID=UPI0030D03139